MKILVTGGAGFIGSAVVRHILAAGRDSVVNLDKLTYAANLDALGSGVEANPNYAFEHADICDGDVVKAIFARHRPDAVMHLAAESHVDRSIDGPADFIHTNVVGTYKMLEAAFEYYETLTGAARDGFRFHHISTDEVFGSLGEDDAPFSLSHAYDPRSPYSASKASADHLARAWYHTYGLPVVVSNCSNNYGPYQYPEKLIPLVTISAIHGKPLPVYGKGENVRDWIHVEDHAEALLEVLTRGRPGHTYLVGGESERRNIDVVREICRVLDDRLPDARTGPFEDLIEFVTDRPGHDFRYAIDGSETARELGWRPTRSFEDGLAETVDWYLANRAWWQPLLEERGAVERLGLGKRREGTA